MLKSDHKTSRTWRWYNHCRVYDGKGVDIILFMNEKS